MPPPSRASLPLIVELSIVSVAGVAVAEVEDGAGVAARAGVLAGALLPVKGAPFDAPATRRRCATPPAELPDPRP